MSKQQHSRSIAIFGLGYVGTVTGACLASMGHRVIGVDVNQGKVDLVNRGVPPVVEPELDQLLRTQVKNDRLSATASAREAVAGSDFALVCVGTPSFPDGRVDDTSVQRVMSEIAAAAGSRNYLICIRSTLLPGILEDRLLPLVAEYPRIEFCIHPEFLRESTAVDDFFHPPLIVVGTADEAVGHSLMNLYDSFDCPKVVTDTRTASMVKYACNAFHGMKVSFANEIGVLARTLGIDGQEVMRIACLDRHLNISPAYLNPGFAFGGSCIPKDLRALCRLAQLHALKTDVLDATLTSNDHHLDRAIETIRRLPIRKIGLFGLSFKSATDDLRESPFVKLAERLIGLGFQLRIHDPGIKPDTLSGTNLHYVDQHLPHLAKLLVPAAQAASDAELLLLGTVRQLPSSVVKWGQPVIDLQSFLVVGTPDPQQADPF